MTRMRHALVATILAATAAAGLVTTAAPAAAATPTCAPAAPQVVGTSGTAVVITVPTCGPVEPGQEVRISTWIGTGRTVQRVIRDTQQVEIPIQAGTAYRFSAAMFDVYELGGPGPEGALTAHVVPPFATVDGFIDRQFADFAGRTPTTSERSFWRSQITGGAPTTAAIDRVAALQAQPYWQVQSPIVRLYQAYFLRLPDLSGLQYWTGRHRTGTSLNTISAGFAGSQEFRNRYGSLGNRAFVELVYQNVLGRPGEDSGVAYWTQQLDQRRKTRGQVMTGFSESGEYKTKTRATTDQVNIVTGMLKRVPNTVDRTELSTHSAAGMVRIILERAGYAARPGIGIVAPPVVVFTDIGTVFYGQAYSGQVGHRWGQGAVTFTATGLPPGLSMSSAGAITGTTKALGTYVGTVTVRDQAGKSTSRALSIQVDDPGAPIVNHWEPLPTASRGEAYSYQVTHQNGAGPVTYAATGLPAGLSISTSGLISGTPTGGGAHSVTVSATDEPGRTGSHTFALDVVPVLLGVTDVAAGGRHSCGVRTGGTVACWGANDAGQLGQGSTSTGTLRAVTVPGISGVTAIDAGGDTTCAIVAEGAVRCWGEGSSGQVGDGQQLDRTAPTAVSGITGATDIDVGVEHACAATSAGLTCWGRNDKGQLGVQPTGSDDVRATPVAMPGSSGFTSPAAGWTHTCAATPSGVACWGDPTSGKTFHTDDETVTQPWVPTTAPLTNVTRVVAGELFACALHSGGAASCWGDNTFWQLGEPGAGPAAFPVHVRRQDGSPVPAATQLAAGRRTACTTSAAGAVWCWGYGGDGQTGTGTLLTGQYPTAIATLTGATRLALGSVHTCAADTGGRAWCWGLGTSGQLGDGKTTGQRTPVKVTEA